MQNKKRDVRLTTSGIISTRTLGATTIKGGIQSKQNHFRPVDHETRQTSFTLDVNDFAIKFTKMEDAQHLIETLKQDYTITIDWGATKYIGLTIDWDYNKGQVHVHMPGYLDKVFLKFKHVAPSKKQNSPHPHAIPQYGAKSQFAESQDKPPSLIKRTQSMSRL